MVKSIRNYACKDIEMLTAANTIVRNFRENMDELAVLRGNWSVEYADDLLQRIHHATEAYIGLDAKSDQKTATDYLVALMSKAKKDLSIMKTQIEQAFKDDGTTKNRLLNDLGFNAYFTLIQNGDQEAMASHLSAFKKETENKYRPLLIEHHFSELLMDRIIAYTNEIIQLNNKQEIFKMAAKTVPAEYIGVYNGLYDELMMICKTARSYYSNNETMKRVYSFSKNVEQLNFHSNKKEETVVN